MKVKGHWHGDFMEKRNDNVFWYHINSSAVTEEFVAVASHRVGLGLKDQGCTRAPSERTAGDNSGPAGKGCAHVGQGRHNCDSNKGAAMVRPGGCGQGRNACFFQSHLILGQHNCW